MTSTTKTEIPKQTKKLAKTLGLRIRKTMREGRWTGTYDVFGPIYYAFGHSYSHHLKQDITLDEAIAFVESQRTTSI